MKNTWIIFLMCCIMLLGEQASFAQKSTYSIYFSNNNAGLPALSYPKLFYEHFHPGIELQYSRRINKNEKNKIHVRMHTAYYYHQFVQSLFKIYPSLLYNRYLSDKFDLYFGLGAGYGLSFEGDRAFILQEDGSYAQKSFAGARSQYLIAMDFGVAFKLSSDGFAPMSVKTGFTSMMQGTYVKSYVPLLPLNGFFIGIEIPIN